MDFMNGVILINEIMMLSTVGSLVLVVVLFVFYVISLGGANLYINGRRCFSTWRENVGLSISFAGIALLIALWVSFRCNLIIPIADEFGLAEHTGTYEVSVTADTDMNEFQERYEIIDYENGVYTIKIKS